MSFSQEVTRYRPQLLEARCRQVVLRRLLVKGTTTILILIKVPGPNFQLHIKNYSEAFLVIFT